MHTREEAAQRPAHRMMSNGGQTVDEEMMYAWYYIMVPSYVKQEVPDNTLSAR